MPAIFRKDGFRFHFYSDEGEPLEPAHIHITKAGHDAKFWLSPNVKMAYNYGFSARTLVELEKMVVTHRDELERAWHDYFGTR